MRSTGPLTRLGQNGARGCLGQRLGRVDVAEAFCDALLQDVYGTKSAAADRAHEGGDQGVARRIDGPYPRTHASGDRGSPADIVSDRVLLFGRCLVWFTQGPCGGPILIAQPILDFTDDTAGDEADA
jgi:hypothetical protein